MSCVFTKKRGWRTWRRPQRPVASRISYSTHRQNNNQQHRLGRKLRQVESCLAVNKNLSIGFRRALGLVGEFVLRLLGVWLLCEKLLERVRSGFDRHLHEPGDRRIRGVRAARLVVEVVAGAVVVVMVVVVVVVVMVVACQFDIPSSSSPSSSSSSSSSL